MNIVSLLGSPRKNGNTAALLDKVLEGICSKHQVQNEFIFLQAKNIKPCMACESCHKDENSKCVIKDDMQDILSKIEKADLIIVASPIYWWGVTAQTKLFIDRTYGFHGKLENKKIALLMTYGSELPNAGPETVESNYKEICEFIHIKNAGVLGVCSGTTPVAKNSEALKKAFEFGQNL